VNHLLRTKIQFINATNFIFASLFAFVFIACSGSSGGGGSSSGTFNPNDTFSEASLNTTRWTPTAFTGSGAITFTGTALNFNSTGVATYDITTKYKIKGNFRADTDLSISNLNVSSYIDARFKFKQDETSSIRLVFTHVSGVGIRVSCYSTINSIVNTESVTDIGNSFPMNNITLSIERNASQVYVYVNGNVVAGLDNVELQANNPTFYIKFGTATSGTVNMQLNDWNINSSSYEML